MLDSTVLSENLAMSKTEFMVEAFVCERLCFLSKNYLYRSIDSLSLIFFMESDASFVLIKAKLILQNGTSSSHERSLAEGLFAELSVVDSSFSDLNISAKGLIEMQSSTISLTNADFLRFVGSQAIIVCRENTVEIRNSLFEEVNVTTAIATDSKYIIDNTTFRSSNAPSVLDLTSSNLDIKNSFFESLTIGT